MERTSGSVVRDPREIQRLLGQAQRRRWSFRRPTRAVQAAVGRGPTLEMPKLDPASPEFLREVDRIMNAAGLRDGSH